MNLEIKLCHQKTHRLTGQALTLPACSVGQSLAPWAQLAKKGEQRDRSRQGKEVLGEAER